MKIKKAPVSDLIAYFIELYNKDITGTEHTSIPDIISSYYQKIAGSRIPIYEKILIEDWCFSSWGEIEDMPWTEGVLVKNKNGDFGITCYTGARDMGRANYDEYDLLYVYFLDHNILTREYFHPEDWELYGIMTEYFLYKNINVGQHYTLGTRSLGPGRSGNDVLMLQKLLRVYDGKTELSGYFDKDTEKSVKNAQYSFSLPATGMLAREDILLTFLGGDGRVQ